MEPSPITEWHRLFGLLLFEFFKGTPFEVELERDLSIKQQMLDVIIVNRRPGEELNKELPDGMENLAAHNLISYKSHHEAFDAWTVKELIGHYVNYRKQLTGRNEPLVPEADFKLFGISTRFPAKLASEERVTLGAVSQGVYDLQWGTDRIRLLVLKELPETDGNAMFLLFSQVRDRVRAAQKRFRLGETDTTTFLGKLWELYREEKETMPLTMEDLEREMIPKFLAAMTPQQRVAGLSAEERLEGLPVEERLRGLPVEDRLRDLTPEDLQKLRERLKELP